MPSSDRAYDKARNASNRSRVDQIKVERGCMDCGYRAHPRALHFDHPPGVKKSTPYRGNRQAFHINWSWPRIERAIAVCEVVCANCHAIRTAERTQPLQGGHDARRSAAR